MMDTVIMQDRIGQLCHQFKLPTMGAQSVDRFTAAGHGDALPIFLKVLEQEAEDRRHRRINRLRRESRLPSGKTWETFVFTGAGSSSMIGCPGPTAATGPAGPGQLCRARRQRAGLRTARHWQDPRPVRHRPPPGRSRPLRPLRSGLPPGAEPAPVKTGELLVAKRDLDLPRRLRGWTTSTSCSWTTWATCPRAPRSPRSSSP